MDNERTFGAPDPADGTRAGSFDRKFVNDSVDDIADRGEDSIEEARAKVHGAADAASGRADDMMSTGRNRIAGQIESLGDRLEERGHALEDAGGVQRRAGQAVVRASEGLNNSADYRRTHDVSEMRDDLEYAIRERPLFSVGLALGAGFLLARLIRD
jgi:ElaB/YqjD/DUF883 family membrane-anchored ribosome-binding protein